MSDDNSIIKRAASLAFLIRVGSAGVVYLGQIVLARLMGTSEFGIYAYAWTWVVVVGSLAEGGFDEGSDIDMAILGVSPGADAVLASELETMLALAGFAADVIPDRFLPASLRDRISRHGLDVAALG